MDFFERLSFDSAAQNDRVDLGVLLPEQLESSGDPLGCITGGHVVGSTGMTHKGAFAINTAIVIELERALVIVANGGCR